MMIATIISMMTNDVYIVLHVTFLYLFNTDSICTLATNRQSLPASYSSMKYSVVIRLTIAHFTLQWLRA
ncbi:hypothetical protein M378DRAFT_161793 [Amanita muscaria Koide BX008]|uniref:Uncharacterized protein n=1 Tax=Amanita muscaria (strain Koide BX008) TaxID=946122 RepID=A0A0C2WVH3_AMAMK|nr:hypothetical protein M378DRAFT_161793 [Amanita muscaria Koide BX008]